MKITKTLAFLGLFGLILSCGGKAADDKTLINGEPADPKDWPASVYAAAGNSRCSATLVGERVLLFAAHCVRNGAQVSFSAGPNSYRGTCTHAPDYKSNSTADWALCLIESPITGVEFEVVNTDPELVKVDDELTLTGYGCVNPGGGGGNDGIYRTGKATVVQVPSGRSNDIVTRSGAALCYGDSGGPAFHVNGQTRKQVGVNSRGNISTTSYLSSVGTQMAQNFFKSWSQDNETEICGLSEKAKKCRDKALPPPPLPNEFTVDSKAASITAKVKPGFEKMLAEIKKAIEVALARF